MGGRGGACSSVSSVLRRVPPSSTEQALNLVQAVFLRAVSTCPSTSFHPFVCAPTWAALATLPWLLRSRFPVHSFSDNYTKHHRPVTSFLYRLKKWQYVLYKHMLLHGLNVSVAVAAAADAVLRHATVPGDGHILLAPWWWLSSSSSSASRALPWLLSPVAIPSDSDANTALVDRPQWRMYWLGLNTGWWLCCCAVVLLCCCAVVLLCCLLLCCWCCCAVVLLCCCAVVLLCCCAVVLLSVVRLG
jgi:hypothetical protein